MTLSQINSFVRDEFVRVIGPVFEHSPWIAEATWPQRPFASLEELHRALCATMGGSPDDEKLALIRAHPDLVGGALLTAESQGEQSAAGLMELSPDEKMSFAKYNSEYHERFGFPFVICARLNKKEAILRAFPERLKNSRAQEMQTALAEIFKIAELRLNDLIQ